MFHMASRKSYLVIIGPMHMKTLPKSKLGQVGSNIAQNHSFSTYEVYGRYLPNITWKLDQNWN